MRGFFRWTLFLVYLYACVDLCIAAHAKLSLMQFLLTCALSFAFLAEDICNKCAEELGVKL